MVDKHKVSLMKFFRVFCLLSIVALNFIIVGSSFAGLSGQMLKEVGEGAVSTLSNPATMTSDILKGSMAALLCSYRLLLCGKVTVVIVATAIFIMGMLIITQKMRWPYAILIIAFTTILVNPEMLVRNVMKFKIFGADITALGTVFTQCNCQNAAWVRDKICPVQTVFCQIMGY